MPEHSITWDDVQDMYRKLTPAFAPEPTVQLSPEQEAELSRHMAAHEAALAAMSDDSSDPLDLS